MGEEEGLGNGNVEKEEELYADKTVTWSCF